MRFTAFYVAGGVLLGFALLAGAGALDGTPPAAGVLAGLGGLGAIVVGAIFEAVNV